MNDAVLKKIFEKIGLESTTELSDCSVENVYFGEKSKCIELDLSFENVPPIYPLYRMNKALKEGLVQIGACKKVLINYDYKNKVINEEHLKTFYEFTIEKLAEKKFIFQTLINFQTNFFENKILVYIGDEKEVESVNQLLSVVNASFCALGINFVEINAILNESVESIKQHITDSFTTDLSTAIINSKNKPKDKTEEKEKTYKPVKNKSNLNGKPVSIATVPSSENELVDYKQKYNSLYFLIEGVIRTSNINVTASGYRIYEGTVVDDTSSIKIKTFISESRGESEEFYRKRASADNKVRVYGLAAYDNFSRDVVIKIFEIISYGEYKEEEIFKDDAPIKRVELHAHSKMTFLDSVLSIKSYVQRAKQYGHTAIALTDKNTVQGLGDLNSLATKAKIKPIFGIEAYYVNEKNLNPAFTDEDIPLKDAVYTVLDFETTGINTTYNEIIEIGAAKVYRGEIIDKFSTFINPRRNIPAHITKLTTITNDDVRNAPFIEEVLPKFMEFIKGTILVAQNANFDIGQLKHNIKKLNYEYENYPVIDTMQIGRAKYSHLMKRFNLEELCKAFNVVLETHHRAIDDSIATAEIFIKMLNDLANDGITNYNQINNIVDVNTMLKFTRPTHITMLALNRKGLVNINRMVSDAHTNHIAKTPKFVRSVIDKHREGILIGSGCLNGEIFETALNKDYEDILKLIDFYDFIEVQPLSCYSSLVEKNNDEMTYEKIRNVVKRIIKAAGEKNKMVVATGDVHELDPKDTIFRNIIYDKPLIGGGIHEYNGLDKLPKSHYRNTEEMLKEFEYLGTELAYEIVVTNSNKIADQVEIYNLFPEELFAPGDDFMSKFGIPSAIEDLKRLTYETAKNTYGDPLPQIIVDRLNKELGSIIKYKYGSIYYIAYLLVKHSRDAGYVVGSRGSVGSSLVATFMGITEVNSLAPHYVCPHCKFSAFKYTKEELEKYTLKPEELELQEFLKGYDSGLDLPKKICPICGKEMEGNGVNIPFETFLGFKGDKVPDIDLNFSGEYQARAHAFCREIFGIENTFRGGTIGTIAKRTAENYIKDYYVKRGKVLRNCEVENMTENIMGIKRQTGQHPGGIVVVPEGVDVNEVTPVQFPADDVTSDWKTTHIDYHKFESNLLKLDILGHDDPTMMRYLMNFVDEHPEEFPFKTVEEIPLNDENVLKMFSGIDILGVTYDQVLSKVGSTGLPEFGTNLTKDMCYEIKPSNISDLIRISGLSHGTMVWNGNEREYFLGKKPGVPAIPIKNLICCRDDIMETLIEAGLPSQNAFKIMESVRKGRGVDAENEALMRKYDVPEWYIQICKDIQYLFPKAHATAYVIMALRIAWFKYYKPLYFYSGFFSKRTDFFEVQTLQGGYEAVRARTEELEAKYGNLELSEDDESQAKVAKGDSGGGSVVKQKKLLVGLKVALEMMARGYGFIGVNINKSDALNFKIEGNNLIIPFKAIDSFGENTANSIVQKRGDAPFTSINDAIRRGHISPSLHDKLAQVGAFDGLPKEDKLGIFKYIDDKKD